MTSIFAVQNSQIGLMGQVSSNTVNRIACDLNGNVYISGRFTGVSTFGLGVITHTSTDSGFRAWVCS